MYVLFGFLSIYTVTKHVSTFRCKPLDSKNIYLLEINLNHCYIIYMYNIFIHRFHPTKNPPNKNWCITAHLSAINRHPRVYGTRLGYFYLQLHRMQHPMPSYACRWSSHKIPGSVVGSICLNLRDQRDFTNFWMLRSMRFYLRDFCDNWDSQQRLI